MRCWIGLWLFVSGFGAAQAQVITVGANEAGAPCNFSTIDAAIASIAPSQFGIATLRIARNQAYSNVWLRVPPKTMVIEGGFANCAATTPSSTNTTLSGSSAHPVIEVAACGSACNPEHQFGLTLRGLTLAGGSSGLVVRRATALTMGPSVSVDNNGYPTTSLAGGIDLDGTALPGGGFANLSANLEGVVVVSDNQTSSNGGGIRCASAFLTLSRDVLITRNTATQFGGGIYAGSDCVLRYGSGGIFRGTVSNTATRGGGMYLANGARLSMDVDASTSGTAVLPIVSSNDATEGGAGIYSAGASVQISAGVFNSNENNGVIGAAAAIEHFTTGTGDSFSLRATTDFPSLCTPACIDIRNNTNTISAAATPNAFDGAVAVFTSNAVTIQGVAFRDNTLSMGDVNDQISSSNATVLITSNRNISATSRAPVLFARNLLSGNAGTLHAVSFRESGTSATQGPAVDFINNTLSGNGLIDYPSLFSRSSIGLGADTQLSVQNSIVIDSGSPWIAATGGLGAIAPTVTSSMAGAQVGGFPSMTYVQTAANTFVNPADDDFDLRVDLLNLAIDNVPCPDAARLDIERDPVFDYSAIPDVSGPCDLGADESTQVLFKDGFEA